MQGAACEGWGKWEVLRPWSAYPEQTTQCVERRQTILRKPPKLTSSPTPSTTRDICAMNHPHTHTHTDTRAGNVIKLCYALVLFHPAPAPPPTPLPHPLRAIFAAAYAISYHVRHALCTFGKGVNGWRCGRELGTCRVANIIIFIIMTVVVTIKTITKTKVVSLHGN